MSRRARLWRTSARAAALVALVAVLVGLTATLRGDLIVGPAWLLVAVLLRLVVAPYCWQRRERVLTSCPKCGLHRTGETEVFGHLITRHGFTSAEARQAL